MNIGAVEPYFELAWPDVSGFAKNFYRPEKSSGILFSRIPHSSIDCIYPAGFPTCREFAVDGLIIFWIKTIGDNIDWYVHEISHILTKWLGNRDNGRTVSESFFLQV